jgi:hypothetical protein
MKEMTDEEADTPDTTKKRYGITRGLHYGLIGTIETKARFL